MAELTEPEAAEPSLELSAEGTQPVVAMAMTSSRDDEGEIKDDGLWVDSPHDPDGMACRHADLDTSDELEDQPEPETAEDSGGVHRPVKDTHDQNVSRSEVAAAAVDEKAAQNAEIKKAEKKAAEKAAKLAKADEVVGEAVKADVMELGAAVATKVADVAVEGSSVAANAADEAAAIRVAKAALMAAQPSQPAVAAPAPAPLARRQSSRPSKKGRKKSGMFACCSARDSPSKHLKHEPASPVSAAAAEPHHRVLSSVLHHRVPSSSVHAESAGDLYAEDFDAAIEHLQKLRTKSPRRAGRMKADEQAEQTPAVATAADAAESAAVEPAGAASIEEKAVAEEAAAEEAVLRAEFDRYDMDEDGVLKVDEVKSMMVDLGGAYSCNPWRVPTAAVS